jgi:transposase-like protein
MAALTEKQQYWSEQLEQANAFDGSLADYARHQGIRVQTLYQWRSALRKREITSAVVESGFTEVLPSFRINTSLTVQIGNAQLAFNQLPDAEWLARLIVAND